MERGACITKTFLRVHLSIVPASYKNEKASRGILLLAYRAENK